MSAPSIRRDTLDELRRQLRQIKDKELDNELKAIHLELARVMIARAAPNVPIGKTKKLKPTLRAAGTKEWAIARIGKASVAYAPVVHWGERDGTPPARPFLRKAAQSLEANIVDRYDRQVAQMLDRVIGRG